MVAQLSQIHCILSDRHGNSSCSPDVTKRLYSAMAEKYMGEAKNSADWLNTIITESS